MFKKAAIAALSLLLVTGMAESSLAETVMEKVARTGVLTAGTQRDAIPFGYVNDQGEWVGYSIEILALIKHRLEQELGKEIQLELVEVNVSDRIPRVISRELDIVCDASSFTWEREAMIDFSASYFVTGTRLLAKKGSGLGTPESLVGKRIGVIANTKNNQVMRLIQPNATFVTVTNRQEGLMALQKGEIDALASDGILLEGLRRSLSNMADYEVVPGNPYTREGIACMMPEDGSNFRDAVNYSIISFMQGFIMGESEYTAVFDHWFGANGVVPLDRKIVVDYFQRILDTYEQVPVDQL